MKLKYPIGIELTGVPRVPFDEIGFNNTAVWEKRTHFRKELPKRYRRRAHVDGHCYEVPSPILHSREEARRFFMVVRKQMKKYKMKPHHPRVVCGGGHIHVGGLNMDQRMHVFHHVANRPWLPWIFSQPDEEESCDNIRTYTIWGVAYNTKTHSVSCSSYSTVEFRFFEAPLNWSEQWDHIDFTMRFVSYVLGEERPPVRFWGKELQRISKQDCIVSFRKLLGALGLSYPRYEKYIQRNLLPRWRLNRRRR